MDEIGFHDLSPETQDALKAAPSVLRNVMRLSRGKEKRVYVRLESSDLERPDMEKLLTSPLFARLHAPGPIMLVFDPDAAAGADRERRRAEKFVELGEVAPEVVQGIISQEMTPPGT